jgi:hypothetical protein
MTVFIRIAAKLTHLLLKGSKFRNGNKNQGICLKCPFRILLTKGAESGSKKSLNADPIRIHISGLDYRYSLPYKL